MNEDYQIVRVGIKSSGRELISALNHGYKIIANSGVAGGTVAYTYTEYVLEKVVK